MSRQVLKSSLLGILWGAAVAVLEAVLFNRWFRAELQLTLATFELVLNYALYAGVAAVVVRVLVGALGRGRGWRADPLVVVESLLAAAAVVLVLFNFLQVGPLAPRRLLSAPIMAMAAAAVVAFMLAAAGLYRLRPWWRRAIRAVLLVGVAAGLLWQPLLGKYAGMFRKAGSKAPAGSFSNVLLIVTDTMRWDYLDCYGAAWKASPAADRLAARGTLFANQIAQSTWTLPSTASLLTGMFPSSHGAVGHGRAVSTSATTLAQVLQGAGFRTAAFTENLHILPRNGFGRGFDDFWACWLPWVYDSTVLWRVRSRLGLPAVELTQKKPFPWPVDDPTEVNWDARATAERALAWLGSLDDAPFLAYIHFMGPHGPYGPPEFLLDRDRPPVAITNHPRPMGDAYPLGEAGAAVSDEELETIKTLYAADVLYVEREIARVLDWLEESGRRDETLVVLTSDHGEEFFEHDAWNHGSTAFDEVLRVPMIMAIPGAERAGGRIDDCTRHIDVMPTLLDILGLPLPERMQGRSLKPLLEGGSLDPIPAYTEVYPVRPPDCSIVSLVRDRHKIVKVDVEDRSAILLYDLEADPAESNDLSTLRPDVCQALLEDLDIWSQVARQYSPESATVPMDARTRKLLKSLGYIN